jgi:hypothetical protein
MKLFMGAIMLTSAVMAYGQAVPSPSGPPGAYSPHPNDPGMDLPSPADRSPRDVFIEDPKLAGKLQKLLPEDITPQQFCDGFKTLGGCVAAMHATKNLGIPVSDLKTKVVDAKPKKDLDKLESAIHELKPNVDAKAERKKAQKQAERDLPVSN